MADSIPYRAKWQAIKSFVSWKPNDLRALTPPEKSVISRYFSKIGRLKAGGYTYSNRLKPAAILKINKNQRFAAPLLKGAWIKCPPGAKPHFSADGSMTGWTRNGITRVEVHATFFLDDKVEPGQAEREADRVTKALRVALNRKKLSRVAVAYAGGDGYTQSPPVIADMLIIETKTYGKGVYKPMNGIAGFYFARTKNVAKQIEKIKKITAERNARRRKNKRGNI